MAKLKIPEKLLKEARELAADIVRPVQEFILEHTTVSLERAVLRLFGVDGVDAAGVPFPNVLVDNLQRDGVLGDGAATHFANALLVTELSINELCRKVAAGSLRLGKLPRCPAGALEKKLDELAGNALKAIRRGRERRELLLHRLGEGPRPLLYAIVATGNIYEDVIQARASARQGADVIAVIRSTAQSLIDYVPYGATTEGYGGTYATQENFRIMRRALDEESENLGRYIRLVNYSSGLCMAEIAATAAVEGLDMLLNDAMYGILFRDINMQRTFIDQYFSRLIIACADIVINTGEDNYLTTADAFEEAHTVLSSQFINEQFALAAGMRRNRMGLGHAFEMNPDLEDGFLWEVAGAQLIRQCFPEAPLKYMPPTRHKTGNVFKGHLMDAMFAFVSQLTRQEIHLIGVLTEAIHTPFMHDRYLALEGARYVMNNTRHLGDEVEFKAGGRVEKRAQEVLQQAVRQLREIKKKGMFRAIEEAAFGAVSRSPEGGRGLDGVLSRSSTYRNPVEARLRQEAGLPELEGSLR
ncbi:MAG: lysine 5,6-aminomutase subunit alpha [Candidatus Eremiobacterota bacterium]